MVLAIGDTHLKFLYIQSCANAETSPMSLVLHLHLVSATEIVAQCHPRVLGWKDVRTQNEMLDEIHIVPMGHIIGSQRHTQGSIGKILAQAKGQVERQRLLASIVVERLDLSTQITTHSRKRETMLVVKVIYLFTVGVELSDAKSAPRAVLE